MVLGVCAPSYDKARIFFVILATIFHVCAAAIARQKTIPALTVMVWFDGRSFAYAKSSPVMVDTAASSGAMIKTAGSLLEIISAADGTTTR